MEHANSDIQTANHLTGILLGCNIAMWHSNQNKQYKDSADHSKLPMIIVIDQNILFW